MARLDVTIDAGGLTRFYPLQSIRKGWSRQVIAIYTDGKSDRIWPKDVGPDASGTTVSTLVRERDKQLRGVVAIDVAQIGRAPLGSLRADALGPASLSSSKPSLERLRIKVIEILAHEILHVAQAWIHGEFWSNRYRFASAEATLKAVGKDLTFLFDTKHLEAAGYLGNKYEQAAFARSREFVKANHTKIWAGGFDRYLPIEMMKAYAR